ncbi:hypothetical protein TNCV_3515401 [Trichonephila clavipes]|nr:hypothetical protein TNCV_3515401 [Trichonephila clavipes]
MLRRLVGTTAPKHHDCSIQERKSLTAKQSLGAVDDGPVIFNQGQVAKKTLELAPTHFSEFPYHVNRRNLRIDRFNSRVVVLSILTDNLVELHFKYDQARRRFVEWAQNEIAVVPDFHKRILFRMKRTSG